MSDWYEKIEAEISNHLENGNKYKHRFLAQAFANCSNQYEISPEFADHEFGIWLEEKEKKDRHSGCCIFRYTKLTCKSAVELAHILENENHFTHSDTRSNIESNLCNANIKDACECETFFVNRENDNYNSMEIKAIDLAYNNIRLCGALALLKALCKSNMVQYLDLSGNSLSEYSDDELLFEHDNNMYQWEELPIKQNNSSQNQQRVYRLNCKLLYQLEISMCKLLSSNNTITNLYLNDTSLRMEQLISLFHGFAHNKSIRVLHIARPAFIDAEGMKYVVNHLNDALIQRMRYIKNTIYAVDCFEKMSVGLNELNLSFFGLGNDHLSILMPGLQATTSLRTLFLRGNSLTGEDSGRLLCELLTLDSCNLTSLDVGANALKGTGATFLANAMKLHSQLQNVKLDKNKITKEGMMAVITALHDCQQLREINLWGNNALSEQCVIDALGIANDTLHWHNNVHLDFEIEKVKGEYSIYKL